MKLQINVTDDRIKRGRFSSKCACPIALALKEEAITQGAHKDFTSASIDHDKGRLHLTFDKPGDDGNVLRTVSDVRFSLPPAAKKFISDRDAGIAVSPFSADVSASYYTEPDGPNFPPDVFLKPVMIAGGRAQFRHGEKSFTLTSECFDGLNGKTVLIDAGLNVFRSDRKIGKANEI